MIFLKVPVGMRKTATLTMEKPLGVVQYMIFNGGKWDTNMEINKIVIKI